MSSKGVTVHRAYMDAEAVASLINIIYERHDIQSGSYYEIFWYHWPRDGILPWPDFEPVVFAYGYKHELCFVLVRRAWKPIIANPDDVYQPPEVVFIGRSHHQFLRMNIDGMGLFEKSNLEGLRTIDITSSHLTPISSNIDSQIPSLNISGLGENIYEIIERLMLESCEP